MAELPSSGYAVVRFDDESVSEIPISWLSKNRKMCWWPPSKNCGFYISTNKQPNEKTWQRSPVIRVEGYYDTYEKARHEASEITYTTDESEGNTRNVKHHVTKAQVHIINQDIIDHASDSETDNREELESPPLISEDTPVDFQEITVVASRDVTASATCLKCCKDLDLISTAIFSIQEMLKEMNERVCDMGAMSTWNNQTRSEVEQMLPIDSKEGFGELESFLENKEHTDSFKLFLCKTGGVGYKDNISRILKKVLSNEFAVGCSWLGQRGNFRMAGTKTMNIVKEIIIASHTVQEKEVEQCCSEWLRHATQRLKREKTAI